MAVRIVRVAVSPVVILDVLEQAAAALARGEPDIGRRFVDHAITQLSHARAAENEVLDEVARTPEAPGTSLDLGT
jgi:hypothetical protein